MKALATFDLASVVGGYGNHTIFRDPAGNITAMINAFTGAFVKFENGKPVLPKR